MLTKTQQVKMNFWVRDNAALVDVFLDSNCLGSHGRNKKIGFPMGTPTHFRSFKP